MSEQSCCDVAVGRFPDGSGDEVIPELNVDSCVVIACESEAPAVFESDSCNEDAVAVLHNVSQEQEQ